VSIAQVLDSDLLTDEVQRIQSAKRRAYIRAGLTATWLQGIIDAKPDVEAVSQLRKGMHVPLIRDVVKTAADLKFMLPRRGVPR
jgi:hypothetical protein